jgi:hypothetical protein
MINNNLTMTRNNEMSSNVYNNPLKQGQVQDYALYRHIRARFLQQSALYLGASLNDSKVLSLCFSGAPVCDSRKNKSYS